MINERIYRGKRKDNGEWIEGYYHYANDGHNVELHLISDKITGIFTEVISETVNQCTDVPDKNEKKIFEDDILRVFYSDGNNMIEGIGTVKYVNGCYVIESVTFHNYRLDEFCSIEVIGNIHDNPELLDY